MICFGSGFSSPFSTAVYDVGQYLVCRCRDADLVALLCDKAVQKLDLGAAAFEHVLAGRRAMLAAAGPVGLSQTVLVNFL